MNMMDKLLSLTFMPQVRTICSLQWFFVFWKNIFSESQFFMLHTQLC